MERAAAREAFVAAVGRPDDEIDLARAALYVAAEAEALDEGPAEPASTRPPSPDDGQDREAVTGRPRGSAGRAALDRFVEAYVTRLDTLAAQVAPSLAAFRDPADALAEMRHLFAREGFRGNTEDYFDPRNSCLDQVLDRRVGIPITLSIVYLEVGWRCGLPLAGVSFPGHFLVKYRSPDEERYVDAFEGAREVAVAELRTRLARLLGPGQPLRPEHLAAAPKRQILARLNANLKSVYADRGDLVRTLAAVERVLAITPDAPDEVRDRGLLYLGLRAYGRAVQDLERYLALLPEAADAQKVREQLEVATRGRARLN